MTIINYDDALNEATTNGKIEIFDFSKTAPGAIFASGWYMSQWYQPGTPGAGTDPSAGSGTPGAGGTARTGASGSIEFDDQSSDIKYLFGFEGQLLHTSTIQGQLLLLDRLVDVASISLSSTGDKNVNSVALPTRASDGVGVEIFLEVSTSTTVTAPIVVVNYTDTTNATVSTPSFTFPAAATPQRAFLRIPWAAAGLGAKSVQTVSVNTAASAGACTVVLAKVIAELPVMSTAWNYRDMSKDHPHLPRIHDGASLMLAYQTANTPTPTEIQGRLVVIYG